MGRNAPRESWPYVTSFLEENDAPVIAGLADLAPSPGASGGGGATAAA
jgi:hypothetical protein